MEELLYRFNPWWTKKFAFPGIAREKYLSLLLRLMKTREVVLITGLRRVGKTTLMYQAIHRLLKDTAPEKICYISLDNLALKDRSIGELVEAFRKAKGLRHDEHVFLFLDEVHSKPDFEMQLKNLYDDGHAKVLASGSSSLDILMRSPHLTGRQRIVRMTPLSFAEYLRFTGKEVSKADAHLYIGLAEEYVRSGGIPEFVKTGDQGYLQALIDSILYRDVAARHNIRNRAHLADVLTFVAQGVGNPVGLRKISRVLGISLKSIVMIIDLFAEANLIFMVEKEGKVSERKGNPKKLYLADTGLFQVLTDNINLGSLVENLVLLTIRNGGEPRYHRFNGHEVDFVRGKDAWEPKYRSIIKDADLEAIFRLRNYKHRTIITKDVEGERGGVNLVPLWKFLLQNEGDIPEGTRLKTSLYAEREK
jgi:hypothetical protein